MQQCQVISRPIRRADNYWEVTVRLIDNDYSTTLDVSGCQIGDTTRFQSNAMPEAHEEGMKPLIFRICLPPLKIAA